MTFGQAISSGFQNYVNFSTRAPRSEFWFWTLFAIIASVAAASIDRVLFPDIATSPIHALVGLALFLPGIAVSIRRLLILTVFGIILLIVWDCMRGTPGPNRFGPDPLAGVP